MPLSYGSNGSVESTFYMGGGCGEMVEVQHVAVTLALTQDELTWLLSAHLTSNEPITKIIGYAVTKLVEAYKLQSQDKVVGYVDKAHESRIVPISFVHFGGK